MLSRISFIAIQEILFTQMLSNATQSQTPSESSVADLVNHLVDRVAHLEPGNRFVLGIVGYPGAGKSTVSQWLVDGVNDRLPDHPAIIVPMDGYHHSNEVLEIMGLLPLKGIPDTFDSAGFVDLLKQLRTVTDRNVFCPLFDRSIEASIPDAIVIEPKHKLCVVEGNYLLLDENPWDQCRQYLDEAWFLDVSFNTILPRLQERHIQGGRTPDAAMAKVESTDLPNARLIDATKIRAHRFISIKK